MRNRIIVLSSFVLLCLAACNSEKKPRLFPIDGDWMLTTETSLSGFAYEIGVSFQRDTVLNILSNGRSMLGRYSLHNDTMVIKKLDGRDEIWRVRYQSRDTMFLYTGKSKVKYYSRRLEFDGSLELDTLKLFAQGCFGTCPEFELTMTHAGKVAFNPIRYCKIDQATEYTLSDSLWRKINTQFKTSWIHRLDTSRIYSDVDDWSFLTEITYNQVSRSPLRVQHPIS
ncbi:MAG TPA: DUF6438 domain-containing protein [Cyclobacteriaceae bacterium]|nr:DUF6438 domain-containing protein [Cyclobacteriaceae bacterium]